MAVVRSSLSTSCSAKVNSDVVACACTSSPVETKRTAGPRTSGMTTSSARSTPNIVVIPFNSSPARSPTWRAECRISVVR
jgi:hypothetical protein